MTTQSTERRRYYSGLTSGDIVKLIFAFEGVSLTFDQLYYYEKQNLIVPSIRKSVGKGIPRFYSAEDLILLRWLVLLTKNGFHLDQFRSVLKFLKGTMPEISVNPQNWTLVTDGSYIKFTERSSGKTVDVIENTAQYMFVFPASGSSRLNKQHQNSGTC